MEICMTIKNSILNINMSSVIKDMFADDCFLTKYYFVPVRLDILTIPKNETTGRCDIMYTYAKLWISVVCILLQLEIYSSKYATSIPDIDTYFQCMKKIFK